MSRLAGIAAVGLVLLFVLFFARWNGVERVTLDLGLWTFYRVPVTWVAFGSFLLGMGVMLLAGLHADLRVRQFLRDRLAAQDDEPRRTEVDRLQQDLFHPVVPLPPQPRSAMLPGAAAKARAAEEGASDRASAAESLPPEPSPSPPALPVEPSPAATDAPPDPSSDVPPDPPSAAPDSPAVRPAPDPGHDRTEASPPP